MRIHKQLLFNQTLLFIATLAVTIVVSGFGGVRSDTVIQPLELTWANGISVLFFFILFSFLLSRFRVVTGWLLKFFLTILIISGAELALGPFLGETSSTLVAIGLAAVFWLWRRVLIHDIALVLAIGGIAGVLGASMSPMIVIFILTAFALYDIVAVYRTGHMVTLAKNMVASGLIVGFLIPTRLLAFGTPTMQALQERDHMILGSGDSGLPALLVASTLFYGTLQQALLVGFFVLLGSFLMHVLFLNQDERAPMAALPPIATLAIIGYLISLFVV